MGCLYLPDGSNACQLRNFVLAEKNKCRHQLWHGAFCSFHVWRGGRHLYPGSLYFRKSQGKIQYERPYEAFVGNFYCTQHFLCRFDIPCIFISSEHKFSCGNIVLSAGDGKSGTVRGIDGARRVLSVYDVSVFYIVFSRK